MVTIVKAVEMYFLQQKPRSCPNRSNSLPVPILLLALPAAVLALDPQGTIVFATEAGELLGKIRFPGRQGDEARLSFRDPDAFGEGGPERAAMNMSSLPAAGYGRAPCSSGPGGRSHGVVLLPTNDLCSIEPLPKVVTPVKTGVTLVIAIPNTTGSGLRRNDEESIFQAFARGHIT